MSAAPAIVYGGWTPAQLLAMLDDEAYLPPTLALKCNQRADPATGKDVDVPGTQKIEVRRVQRTNQTGAFIEKRYLGRYANRAAYEANLLDLVQNLPRIKGHVVGSVGKFQARPNELLLETPWVGLSVEDWNALLGDMSPFKSSCVAVLALARAVLRATQDFHLAGFVHCDLLLQNIVVGHISTPRKGWYRLNLAETRLIDLEFSLPPLTPVTESSGRQVTIPREWFRDNDHALLWLNPQSHSQQLLPGPIDPATLLPVDYGGMHPDAHARLQRVDWGADFCSVAWWLEALTKNGSFLDDEVEKAAWAYLKALPAKLRAYDRPVDTAKGETVPRNNLPHAPWIAEIGDLIGVHDNADCLAFRMPQSTEAISRVRASPTEKGTLEALQQAAAPAARPPAAPVPPIPPKPVPPKPAAPINKTPPPLDSRRPADKQIQPGSQPKTMGLTIAGALAIAGAGYWYVNQSDAGETAEGEKAPAARATPASAPVAIQAPAPDVAREAAVPTPVAPAPVVPPPPNPNNTLENIRKNLATRTPGTADWLAGFEQGIALFDNAALTADSKTTFRKTLNDSYLKQTQAVTGPGWWDADPAKKMPPPPQAKLWIAATQRLATQTSWLAGLYRLRAVVGQVNGFDASAEERASARKDLAALIAQPNEAALTALPPATILREQENAADLLFAYADFDAANARAAKQRLPTFAQTDLLPMLATMAQGKSPISWLRLGYTAACLLNQPDEALALEQIRKAAQVGKGTPDPVAKTATTYLQRLQAQPKQSICSF